MCKPQALAVTVWTMAVWPSAMHVFTMPSAVIGLTCVHARVLDTLLVLPVLARLCKT